MLPALRGFILPCSRAQSLQAAACTLESMFTLLQGSESSQKLLPREQLLDRYHQHTQHCQACTGALSAFRKLHMVALGLLAAFLFLTAAKVESGTLGANAASTIVAAGAAGAAVAAWQLQQMIERFVFTDYLHAEK